EYQIAVDAFAGKGGDFILKWTEDKAERLLPQIRMQPTNQTVAPGGTAIFVVVAERVCGQGHVNCPDPSHFPDEELKQIDYQWFLNGDMIRGETNNMLVVSNVSVANIGRYVARVTYQERSIDSDDADLQLDAF